VATDGWAQRLRERPTRVAAGCGVVIGFAGRNVPVWVSLRATRDEEFTCQSDYPIDCLFPNAIEALPVLIAAFFLIAAVTLALLISGLILLAVAVARLRTSQRAGTPPRRVDNFLLATSLALLTPAAWTIVAFMVHP
jgi:hypothetical protein